MPLHAVLELHDRLELKLNEVYKTNIGDYVRLLELKDARIYFEVLDVSGVVHGAYWKNQEDFVDDLLYTGKSSEAGYTVFELIIGIVIFLTSVVVIDAVWTLFHFAHKHW